MAQSVEVAFFYIATTAINGYSSGATLDLKLKSSIVKSAI